MVESRGSAVSAPARRGLNMRALYLDVVADVDSAIAHPEKRLRGKMVEFRGSAVSAPARRGLNMRALYLDVVADVDSAIAQW
jgi:Co/Zn/Cd efflux system component